MTKHVIAAVCACAAATAPTPAQGHDQGAAPAQDSIPAETLDELLAPIALYPDALILQIVECAGSPYQVKQVNEWLSANPDLKGTAAQDGAGHEGFDASFVAIVLFPQVVRMMAEQPDWTRDLGEAFAKDRAGAFDSIQRLRAQAQDVGNLETSEQVSRNPNPYEVPEPQLLRVASSGQCVIGIVLSSS